MSKPCDCKWYNRCTKKPGCTKHAQAAPVNAQRPSYVARPTPRTETVVERTVETSYDSGADLGTAIAIGMMIYSTPDVTVCPAPVYVAEPAYVAPEPVYYSPPPAPAYEPAASSSYDSSSYSSSSDYGSSSSYDSGSSYDSSSSYSSSSDW